MTTPHRLGLGKCAEPDCFAPEVGCNLGEDNFRACRYWLASLGENQPLTVASDELRTLGADESQPGVFRALWSGNAFGRSDLALVAARGQPRILGIVGAQNAGKTTILASAYLELRRSGLLGVGSFAGSYTLGGWEALAQALQWAPGRLPTFPAHTASNVGRLPGLLHLASRDANEALTDVLVTDAPGEWFSRWAVERAAPDAAGARWVAQHADAFAFVIDSEALAGPDRGEARASTASLAQRLGAVLHARSVAVVWAKADIEIPPVIKHSVSEAVSRFLPDATHLFLSIRSAAADKQSRFLDLFEWVLRLQPGRVLRSAELESASQMSEAYTDPFLAFRTSAVTFG